MRVKLYESKWKNKIIGNLADDFYHNIEDANIEGVKDSSIAILEKCKEFFDEEEDDYIITDINALISEFEDAEEADKLDELLEDVYDFCDDYLILIDVDEEPDDAEVYLDSDKDIGTHNKLDDEGESGDDIEQIEVIEIDPESEDEVVEIE